MTAYAAAFTTASSSKLTLVPSSTYQVRIARVEVNAGGSGTGLAYAVNVYPSNTPTGGSAVTPLSMRAGSPTATATVKSGTTISGTNTLLHTEVQSNADGTVLLLINSNYNFPFDLILSSGSTLAVALTPPTGGGTLTAVVYWEELRLAWAG